MHSPEAHLWEKTPEHLRSSASVLAQAFVALDLRTIGPTQESSVSAHTPMTNHGSLTAPLARTGNPETIQHIPTMKDAVGLPSNVAATILGRAAKDHTNQDLGRTTIQQPVCQLTEMAVNLEPMQKNKLHAKIKKEQLQVVNQETVKPPKPTPAPHRHRLRLLQPVSQEEVQTASSENAGHTAMKVQVPRVPQTGPTST